MPRHSRFALLLCSIAAFGAVSRPAADALPSARAAISSLPLRFEANQGQFDPAVRYAARTANYDLLLTSRGAAMSAHGARVDLTLLHSNTSAAIEPLDRMASRTDYFTGTRANWRTNVANYSRVRYRSVYPGIDVVYYGRGNQLEYDFVLQPGADPRKIRLQFRGARALSITPDGDVAFDSAGGRMLQKRPVIYQDGREVGGRYVMLSRHVVGLKIDRYDSTRALTIDPVLVFSSYLGATHTDQIIGAKLDAKGRLYVVGSTDHSTDSNIPDLAPTDNTYQAASGGLTDVFIAVLNTTGGQNNLLYFSYLGGSGLDVPHAMQLDSAGRVYIAGSTTSTNFPTAGLAVVSSGGAGAVFAFVSVVDPALDTGGSSLYYSTYLGTNTGNTVANAIDVDAQGNMYVIGTTRADDFPVTSNAYQPVRWGLQDAFLSELTIASSNMLYSTYLGGEGDDDGRCIAVTPQGLVYFAINTLSQQFPQAGGQYSPVSAGSEDIAIGLMDMKKSGTDSLLYTSYFGGSGVDEARKIALDAKGNLLVTGFTLSTDLPVTGDAAQPKAGGGGDAFVAIVNATNPKFIQYLTYLGGAHGEVGYDVAADASGSIYVTGYTLSSNFPVTADAPQSHWGFGIDVFLTKVKPGAGVQYSTYLGGATVNVGYGLALAPDGTVYVVGSTGGLLSTTDNPLQGTFGGGYTDGFIAAIK